MSGIYWGREGLQYEVKALLPGSNTGDWRLGHVLALPDNREYAFAINDGTAEVAGNLYQAAIPIANHANRSADVARAVGASVISASVGATVAAQDLYMEGYANINVGASAGEGFLYKIKRAFAKGDAHAAFAGSDAIVVNLADGETIKVALIATTSKVTYQHNRWRNVIICPTTRTAHVAGVAPYAAAASIPYWSQVEGYASVATQGTVVVGNTCVPSTTTAGAVSPAATPATDGPVVGHVAYVAATATFSVIDLKLGH